LASVDQGRRRAVLPIDTFFAESGVLLWLECSIGIEPRDMVDTAHLPVAKQDKEREVGDEENE